MPALFHQPSNQPISSDPRCEDVTLSTYLSPPGASPPQEAPPADGVLKSCLKPLILGAYKHTGLMRVQEAVRARRKPPYITVLLFHRVTDEIAPDGLTVSTAWFRDFCRLMQRSYRVVGLDEVHRYLSGECEGPCRPPRRTVAITFDDCYADNLPAARMLAEHGLPATFFVPTQYISTEVRMPWDSHLPVLRNLSWDDLREMVALGHDIGSHTVSHPDLSKLTNEEALAEMTDSRRVLEGQLARPCRWLAIPYGSHDSYRPEHAELARRAGYAGSWSAIGGFVGAGSLSTVMPRVAVPYFRNLTQLELHINRCLDWVYALKRRWNGAGRGTLGTSRDSSREPVAQETTRMEL